MKLERFTARLFFGTDLTGRTRLHISETIVTDAFVTKYIINTICIIATIIDFKRAFVNNIHFYTFDTITNETFFTFACKFFINLKAICIDMTTPATLVTVSMSFDGL